MDLYGSPVAPLHGNPISVHGSIVGVRGSIVGVRGSLVGTYGFPRGASYILPWASMGLPWVPMDVHGSPASPKKPAFEYCKLEVQPNDKKPRATVGVYRFLAEMVF